MKMNKWTVGLAAAGVVSLASTAQAEENSVLTALSSTVISGSVEASYVGGFSNNNNMHNDGGFEANGASLDIGSLNLEKVTIVQATMWGYYSVTVQARLRVMVVLNT